MTRQRDPVSDPSRLAPEVRRLEPGGAGPTELVVVRAARLEDAETVLLAVRAGCAVVLHTAGVPVALGRRIVDFACGGVEAMDGQAHRIGEAELLLVPALARVQRSQPPEAEGNGRS